MSSNEDIKLIGVDKEIYKYLNLEDPKSFLLYAGAGSGKTRSLVNVLKAIRKHDIQRFIKLGQRLAIITYTNAACDEIKHRLHYDPIFHVSTIHSFVWDLINPFNNDIREWLKIRLSEQIHELDSKIDKARDKQGKTALKNARSRKSKIIRLNEIDNVKDFIYSPTNNKMDKDSLNHAEVIAIGADFISKQPLMKKILINRFPVLLIDESQDTNKSLLEGFIHTQQTNQNKFSLGLFGDMMQRIYGGGKEDIDKSLPEDWKRPEKNINYRSPKRIISLINQIRNQVDEHSQTPKEDAIEGFVRLFIINSDTKDRSDIEQKIRHQMASISLDDMWNTPKNVKCLTLEHAMAAQRGGFYDFFIPLSKVEKLRDAALNGTSREVRFIINQVIPLVNAIKNDDLFETALIIKTFSNLLNPDNLNFIEAPLSTLSKADNSVETFKQLLLENPNIIILDILKFIDAHDLLIVPDKLSIHFEEKIDEHKETLIDEDNEYQAWNEALLANIDSVFKYSEYISEQLGFATHQGVKGLEFNRVMAVLDDSESRGFLFKYEKLFGAVALSKKDIENEREGKDSAPSRTRRLFYVICSRAEKSLAVVAYSENPTAVRKTAIESNWFSADEIILI